jgi:hypothetical protein
MAVYKQGITMFRTNCDFDEVLHSLLAEINSVFKAPLGDNQKLLNSAKTAKERLAIWLKVRRGTVQTMQRLHRLPDCAADAFFNALNGEDGPKLKYGAIQQLEKLNKDTGGSKLEPSQDFLQAFSKAVDEFGVKKVKSEEVRISDQRMMDLGKVIGGTLAKQIWLYIAYDFKSDITSSCVAAMKAEQEGTLVFDPVTVKLVNTKMDDINAKLLAKANAEASKKSTVPGIHTIENPKGKKARGKK